MSKLKWRQILSLESRNAHRILLAPLVITLLAITIFPTIFAVFLSLQDYSLTDVKMDFIGLGNFMEVFWDPRFWNSFRNTLTFILGAVIPELILGLILALLFQQNFRGNRIAKSLFLMPTVTTPVVVGLIWIMLYDPQFGLINYIITELGFSPQAWISNSDTALWVLISVDIWQWTPFVALVLLAGVQSLPTDPYEAALVDGAGRFQRFFYITLPLLVPYFIIAFIFRFMDAFRWFDTIYVMTKGGPGTSTETLNMFAYLTSFKFLDMGYAATITIVMLAMIIIFTQFIIKKINT